MTNFAYEDCDRAEALREVRSNTRTLEDLRAKAKGLGERLDEIAAALKDGEIDAEHVADLRVLVGDIAKVAHDLNFAETLVREAGETMGVWP